MFNVPQSTSASGEMRVRRGRTGTLTKAIFLFIDRIMVVALGVVVIFNGITNYIFGEILAEGYALGVALVYLFTKIQIITRHVFQINSLMIFIIFSVSQILLAEVPIRLIFLYPYVFFILILMLPVYSENPRIETAFLAKVVVFFSCMSAAHAILQRLGFPIVLELEGELRATGLSRSSLNLTGCLFSALAVCIFTVKNGPKKFVALALIFSGLVAAGGRGGVICGVILLTLFYLSNRSNKSSILAAVFFLPVFVVVAGENFYRAFTAFDFAEDQSNLDRLNSYLQFFSAFDFFGAGVGTTSPAALRFVDATGFESLILNSIYELGAGFTLLFSVGIVVWFIRLPRRCRSNFYILSVSIAPMLFGQQLYGIPSAFVSLVLCLYCVLEDGKNIALRQRDTSIRSRSEV